MTKICTKCNIDKDIIEFPIRKNGKDGHRNECKLCTYTIYYNENYRKPYQKEYERKNKDKIKGYRIKYKDKVNKKRTDRKKNDPYFKLICNLRNMTGAAFKINGYKKNSKTEDIIGISFEKFKIYIESQFEPWMNENNQGKYTGNYNETWQLDHIRPISNATTPEEIIKLSHYTNLRPLCSRKNIEKSNKF